MEPEGRTVKLSVIIPVYNERETIEKILTQVHEAFVHNLEKEIVVIDDGSTDGTREFLESLSQHNLLKVLFQQENQGKGAALREGLKCVTGDIVIVQDADLEYDPVEYSRLIQPILDGKADVVFGSRFLGGPHRVLFFWHYVANRFLTTLSNIFTNLNLTDMETGYKVFRTDIIEKIQIKSNRFGFEPEVTAKIARLKCRIYETPISYWGRDYSEGKKITWKDGLVALYCIIRYWLFD